MWGNYDMCGGKAISAICVLLVLVVCSAASYRFLQILPYPIGTGEIKKSPSGRYEASIRDFYDESFFGKKRRWFRFEINGHSKQVLITDPIEGPYFGSRSSISVIRWAEDESYVVFDFPTVEVRLKP